jgi:hypothetical protein
VHLRRKKEAAEERLLGCPTLKRFNLLAESFHLPSKFARHGCLPPISITSACLGATIAPDVTFHFNFHFQ